MSETFVAHPASHDTQTSYRIWSRLWPQLSWTPSPQGIAASRAGKRQSELNQDDEMFLKIITSKMRPRLRPAKPLLLNWNSDER